MDATEADRCVCGLSRRAHPSDSALPEDLRYQLVDHEFVLFERPPLDLGTVAAERAALIVKLEIVDASLYSALQKFHALHPELVPCGPLKYQGRPFWEVTDVTAAGIHFSHYCINHGYDLHDTETVLVPAGFISDSAAWGIAYAAELAASHTETASAATASRRAQYEALRTEFDQQDAE